MNFINTAVDILVRITISLHLLFLVNNMKYKLINRFIHLFLLHDT